MLALGILAVRTSNAGDYSLSLEPHYYGGPRNTFEGQTGSTEPYFQTVSTFNLDIKRGDKNAAQWQVSGHWQSELLGRKDLSLDLDRAYYSSNVNWISEKTRVTVGRIHPWEISENPEASRPWGMLAQSQPQNRGIDLGTSNPYAFPEPVLMGWLGVHSSTQFSTSFSLSASLSPIFIPSMGSEVKLAENDDTSTGRFGRRPPGFVNYNGLSYPLRFKIDQSRIIEDVLLQPQFMLQPKIAINNANTIWLAISRSPSPDPVPETSGRLIVTNSGVQALAEVQPKFPERWQASVTHEVTVANNLAVFDSFTAISGPSFGMEAGAKYGKSSFSFSHLTVRSNDLSSANFADYLVQASSSLSLPVFDVFFGLMHQLKQNDSVWIRCGVKRALGNDALLELGSDIFGGANNTYFGEWRTNDRAYMSFTWRPNS